VQDVVLPLWKKKLKPSRQIRVLRLTALAVAVYSLFFSCFFRIPDYLVMVTQLMSAIYLAGIGCVVWGGLYWRRATTQGAWASVVAGAALSAAGLVLQQVWPYVAHGQKFPVNGQVLAAGIMGVCLLLFVAVSLMTGEGPYDLDKLLHRGKYRVPGEEVVSTPKGFRLSRLVGVNENFTRGDRALAYFTFAWGLAPNVCGLCVVVYNLTARRWTNAQWWAWNYFWSVAVPIVGGVITTVWFTWGVGKDLRALLRDLKHHRADANDDGQVHEKPDGTVNVVVKDERTAVGAG
jgi:SSS family solute:Na+ symporter